MRTPLMQRRAGLLLLTAVMLLLQGCLTVSVTNQSGTSITQAARGQTVLVHVTNDSDDVGLVGFDVRLVWDPTRFTSPVCTSAIAAHDLFSASAPVTQAATQYVRMLALGTTLPVIVKGTRIATCQLTVRANAPLGTTEIRTSASQASTAPAAPGLIGSLKTYYDHAISFTIS